MCIHLPKLHIRVKRVNFQQGTTRHDIENVGKCLQIWTHLKGKGQPKVGRPNQAL